MKTQSTSQIALAITSLCILNWVGTLSGQSLNPLLSSGGVATWSVQTNTQSWNQALGVKYTRQGCSNAPTACLALLGGVAQTDHVHGTLAIPLTTATPAAASAYSQLSRTASYLGEISIDDFVDQYLSLIHI